MNTLSSLKKIFLAFALFALVGVQFSAVPALAAMPDANAPAGSHASYNWSGYVATGGKYTAVSGTWIVPTVAPTSQGHELVGDATWVGIGGFNTKDLIQVGTHALVDAQGRVAYQAWTETLPEPSKPVPLMVRPGDSITGTISMVRPNVWSLSLQNNSNGEKYETQVEYVSSFSSAEWIQEMPSGEDGYIPLDSFGRVQFTRGTALKNGMPVTIANSGATPVTMLNRAGETLAQASALGADGVSFSVSRTDASVVPAKTADVVAVNAGRRGQEVRTMTLRGPNGGLWRLSIPRLYIVVQ